jgi:uncharacterized protein (DUF1800 family)
MGEGEKGKGRAMDERTAIAWLARRVGFGLAPGQLDELVADGLTTTVDRWLDPSAHGVPAAPDPWIGVPMSVVRPRGKESGRQQRALIYGWLMTMAATPRPFEEWMRWFWSGHFVSTLRAVGAPALMRDQLRTWAQYGLGDFPSLLRAATVDTAMLVYLNGNTNQIGEVNENYGREVLELFSLGIGHYSESDVRAGATALTGYVRDVATGLTRFQPARHDDTPQTYLGRSGVHDVDTVVAAIVSHPACGPFIAAELARAVLGPGVDAGLVTRLGRDFVAGGLELRPLMRAIVEAGLDGASTPMVAAPVPWGIRMMRATQVPWGRLQQNLADMLAGAGQVPLDAPNVGGWPGGADWLSASATVARYNLVGWLAYYAPTTNPLVQAATAGHWDAVADDLGRPEGFAAPTRAALAAMSATADGGRYAAADRLTVAMAAPEMVLA